MLDWLVITADQPGVGRGVRGYALYWFLKTYFGRGAKRRTPNAVREGGLPRADTLLLGLPSTLAPDDLRRLVDAVRPRRFAVFDYFDRHELAWSPEQETTLRELTDHYFKPWFEPRWNYGLRMGMLPLRTHRQLFLSIAWRRIKDKFRGRTPPRYDVGFLGRPNATSIIDGEGQLIKLDQRVSWLRNLRDEAPKLSRAGGITEWDNDAFRQRTAAEPDLPSLCYPHNKVTFPAYWRTVTDCRVLLSPGGNAPWTYRHYESLYAGAAVVTIDFRARDMLVPLPKDLMIHAPDGASVAPAVRQALELHRSRPDLAEASFAHLERYLHFGSFHKTRPALRDRFTAQFS